MAFSRAAAFRSCFRTARPTAARPQLFRQIARRGYASGGHESAKAGGDAVWAAGAVAVTAPTCWYLLSSAPDTSHGHGAHGDSHGDTHDEAHDEKEEEESKDEGEAEEAEEKSEDSSKEDTEKAESSEKSEDSESEDEAKEDETPATSDDEGEKKDGNTVKEIPDAKGGIKKRMESEQGMKQGDKQGDDADEAATSKPAGSQNTQSGKQEGVSNTDTKTSIDVTDNSDKSQKSEGGPETAKVKGTVDSSRPQA